MEEIVNVFMSDKGGHKTLVSLSDPIEFWNDAGEKQWWMWTKSESTYPGAFIGNICYIGHKTYRIKEITLEPR